MRKAIDILIDTSSTMTVPIEGGSGKPTRYAAVLSYIRDIIPKIYEPSLHYGLCTFGAKLLGGSSAGTRAAYIDRVAAIEPRPLSELTGLLFQLPPELTDEASTPLADAIISSIAELKKCDVDHRSIFVFSDGQDCGSRATMDDALAAAQEATVTVGWNYFEIYAVGLGSLDEALRSLSERTSGTAIEVKGNEADRIQEVFTDIALKHLSADQHLRRAAEIAVRDVILPATEKLNAGMREMRAAVDSWSSSLAEPNQAVIDGVGANKDAIESLKKSIQELGQSVAQGEEQAAKREKEQLRKIHNARRANFLLGLVNLALLAGLIALTAWTADGVFNMWDVMTDLRVYLTGSGGR